MRSVTKRRFKTSAKLKKGNQIPQKLDSIRLIWFQESNLFQHCRINFYQTHTCVSLLPAFTMPLATSVTVHVIAQTITDITHVKPQWAERVRSEGIHFKNKYKLLILKITLMPQIKEAFVGSNINTKSTLQYPFQFCSNVSNAGTMFSRSRHLLFLLTFLSSYLMFVFFCSHYSYLFNLIFRKSFFVSWVKTIIHTKMCY